MVFHNRNQGFKLLYILLTGFSWQTTKEPKIPFENKQTSKIAEPHSCGSEERLFCLLVADDLILWFLYPGGVLQCLYCNQQLEFLRQSLMITTTLTYFADAHFSNNLWRTVCIYNMWNFDKPYLISVIFYKWDRNRTILYFGWSNWPSVEETSRYVSLASKEFIYILGGKECWSI